MKTKDILALAANKVKYDGQIIVVKLGGETLKKPEYVRTIGQQVAALRLMGAKPVVIHGGGPQIKAALDKAGIEEVKENGIRITDKATLDITVEQLTSINVNLRQQFEDATSELPFPIEFASVSAQHSGLIRAQRRSAINFTGDVRAVNVQVLRDLIDADNDVIPVVSTISADLNTGEPLNVNADPVAGAIANALPARRLIMFSGVENGVLDGQGKRLTELGVKRAQELIEEGVIEEGMKVKVELGLAVLKAGRVPGVVILHPKDIATELFTDAGAPSATLLKLDKS